MNKAIIGLLAVVIYLPADPSLQYLARLGDQSIGVVAATISLISRSLLAS